ncbi:MAG: ThuA domain-containing protein [Geminicoccaceae bacterium]|nr:ThuA domain-containing protein [Geminicoccaceae bacterium]
MILVWNEFRHEKSNEAVRRIYPDGIHAVLAEGLRGAGFDEVETATLDDPEHGLTDERLERTDVLVWWGHKAHGDVDDAVVGRVKARVLDGMGLVVLHSGHFSKIFKALMGTSCDLKWRVADERERLWVVDPSHPIAAGVPESFTIEPEEMYGEHFDVPAPEQLVFVSWFQGGEVFRSGCCWHRGRGRIFYFRPGHETYPTYRDDHVRRVVANGVRWAAPVAAARPVRGNHQSLEPLK